MSSLAIGLMIIVASLLLTSVVMSSVSLYRTRTLSNTVLSGPQGETGIQGLAGSPTSFKTPLIAAPINPVSGGWDNNPAPSFVGPASDYRGVVQGTITWTSTNQSFSVIIPFTTPYPTGTRPGSIVVSQIADVLNANKFMVSFRYGSFTGLSGAQGFTIVVTSMVAPTTNPTNAGLSVSYIVLP